MSQIELEIGRNCDIASEVIDREQELENEIPNKINRLKENEADLEKVNKDLNYLEGEKMRWKIDKEDCIQTAMMDVAMYWRSFDPERYNNPFAYYTSMIVNGLSKGWNKIYGKFKASEMTSLDNNIHSF